MADVVTVTTYDEGNHVTVNLSSVSDGTGEAAVVKVDVSALVGAPAAVAIRRVTGIALGMDVRLVWIGTANTNAYTLKDGSPTDEAFEPPLRNTAGDGKTGDLALTTIGHTAGDTYNIQIDLIKTAS